MAVPDITNSRDRRSNDGTESLTNNADFDKKTSRPQNGRRKKEPQMEFLCPNGHRLFAAKSRGPRWRVP